MGTKSLHRGKRMVTDVPRRTLVRYWCSYLKSERHARRVTAFFEATAEAGWRNILVCSRPPDEPAWASPLKALGVEIVYHPRARGNFDIACVRRTRALLREVRADVFHCDNTHTSPLFGAWLAGTPVRLWSKRAMEPAFEANRAPTVRDRVALSLRLSCRLATRTLAVSAAVADELRAKGIPARKIGVMLNPSDAAPRPLPPREAARRRLGFGDEAFVVLTVGRSVPVKGWDVLLSAAASVIGAVPALRLFLVGSTTAPDEQATRAELDRMVATGGLAGRVVFAGHLADIGDPLSAADLFVLPSRSEGFSLALAEAMRAGLPVVSTRVGIATDLIAPGRNGLIVERDDPVALGRAIAGLAGDPAGRLALGAAASRTGRLPTAGEHARDLLRVYRQMLGDESLAAGRPIPV